jgi:hypothetical protein
MCAVAGELDGERQRVLALATRLHVRVDRCCEQPLLAAAQDLGRATCARLRVLQIVPLRVTK